MIIKTGFYAAACAATLVVTGAASSAVIVQSLPATTATPAGQIYSSRTGLNYMVQVVLPTAIDLTGFSMAGGIAITNTIGTPTLFKIRADVDGKPATTNLYSISDTIDATQGIYYTPFNQLTMLTTNFDPIHLEAGTYWMGLSNNTAFFLTLFNNTPAGERARFNIDTQGSWPTTLPSAFAWQVHGEVATAAVPEPATWTMLIAGFAMIGSTMRRRKAMFTFA